MSRFFLALGLFGCVLIANVKAAEAETVAEVMVRRDAQLNKTFLSLVPKPEAIFVQEWSVDRDRWLKLLTGL